jgi:hypothetical protein
MASVDVLGVNGGDICDCDLSEWVPLEEDWRLCAKMPARDRFGDFCMFNGATTALACLSISSCSNIQSAIVDVSKGGRRDVIVLGVELVGRYSFASARRVHLSQAGR